MGLELELFNFQSVAHQKLTFDGFSTITGRTNLGKSTIFRALRAVLINEHHQSFIRRGAKECLIRVRFIDEPHDVSLVERSKTARKNSYKITMRDGTVREYPKAGEDIPSELAQIGFRKIRTGKAEDHDVIFQSQLDPLFLVTLGSPLVTSFLNRVFNLEKWERALRAMLADAKTLKGVYDQRALDLISLETELEDTEAQRRDTLDSLERLQAAISAADLADQQGERLAAARERLMAANVQAAQLYRQRLLCAEMRRTHDAIGELATLTASRVRSGQLLERLRRAEVARKQAAAQAGTLAALQEPVETLTRQWAAFALAKAQLRRWQTADMQLGDADARVALARGVAGPLDRLGGLWAPLLRISAQRGRLAQAQDIELSARSAVQRVTGLRPLLDDLHGALNAYLRTRSSKRSLRVGARNLEHSIAQAAGIRAVGQTVEGLPDAFHGLLTVLKARQRLAEISTARGEFQARAQAASAALQAAQEADERLRKSLGNCPTCGLQLPHRHKEAA